MAPKYSKANAPTLLPERWTLLAKRRADLTPIKPRKYPLQQYREALIEASSKNTSGAVKVSFAL
jgi:threonine dehydrogenase-like Zn-dependent dehydrogenase